MTTTRIDITAAKGTEEILNEEFYGYCNGVWIEDVDGAVVIKCYPTDKDAFLFYIHQTITSAQNVDIVEEENKDYVSIVRRHFTPVSVGNVTILPPWRNTKKKTQVIFIEPGMAFGTGRHESTKLMIKMMGTIDMTGKRVLDVGTGSGVLALLAAMKGAATVFAVDHDPLSTDAVKKGCEMNNCKDMLIACSGIEALKGTFDVVLANLDFDTFSRHGAMVIERVAKGGYLVASGIEDQFGKAALGLFVSLELIKKTKMNDWHGYLFQKERNEN
jgi:ribosomal protein L11 methyltransferase